MLNVTILRDYDGEWTGLYFNGKLVTESHSLEDYDILNLLADRGLLTYQSKEATTEDRFPDKLEDAILP